MRVVSGICVDSDGLVLMGLRGSNKLRPNLWELPGGKVEPGETDEESLRREWREELGVEIRVVGGPLAESHLDVEAPIDIILYRVVVMDDPKQIDHANLMWVAPEHAVRHMPCSPGFYAQYRAIAAAAVADWSKP